MSEIINFSSTSSGPDGYSVKKNFQGCGALAVIKERQAREDWAAGVKYPPYAEEKGPVAPTVGSLMGHLLQMYHSGNPAPVRAKFTWDGVDMEGTHPQTCAEVRRLHDWYTQKFSVEHWGKFVGQEVPCEIPAEVFGERLSGAIDLITEEDGEEVLNDFKWLGREEATVWEEYSLTHQLFFYAVARELQTGRPVKKVRYLTGFKRKEPGVVPQEYVMDQDYRVRWLKNFVETVQAKRAANRPEPSPSNCIQWGRTCQFLVDGRCSLL